MRARAERGCRSIYLAYADKPSTQSRSTRQNVMVCGHPPFGNLNFGLSTSPQLLAYFGLFIVLRRCAATCKEVIGTIYHDKRETVIHL